MCEGELLAARGFADAVEVLNGVGARIHDLWWMGQIIDERLKIVYMAVLSTLKVG
jgi:hypothetical protein